VAKSSSTSSSSSGFRPIPIAFLIALLIALAFESFQQIYDVYFYLPSTAEGRIARATKAGSTRLRMRLKSRAAYMGEDPAEVVIFGDSSSYVGLIPEVLERRTGMSAYNYATLMREGKISSRLLLNNLMKDPATEPRVIVLCWTPFSLAAVGPMNRRIEFTYSHGNAGLLIEEFGFWGWVRSQIPTLRHQPFLRPLVLDREWPKREELVAIDQAVSSAKRNKGRLPYHEERIYRGAVVFKKYGARFLSKTPVSSSVERHVGAILAMARDHDIKVVAFIAPLIPESYRFYSRAPRWEVISGFFESQRSRLADLEILDVQDQFMDDRYFSDPIHLNGSGARKLSNLAGRAIARLEPSS